MRPDLTVPIVVVALALAACPATGLLPLRIPSSTPDSFLGLALGLVGSALLLVVPWLGASRGRVAAFLTVLAAAAPFLVFGVLEAPAVQGPAAGWLLVLLAGLGASALAGRRGARCVVAALVVLFAGDALLARSGSVGLPAAWNPLRQATVRYVAQARAEPGEAEATEETGLRVGAPVRRGGGPTYGRAVRGRHAVDDVLVRLVGFVATDGGLETRDGYVFVATAGLPDDALALDAFDAALVLPGAWAEEDPDAAAWADRLSTFARRGGFLVGPAPDRAWPAPLGRRLGGAGRARGDGGPSPYGLGHVARAASEDAVYALLDGGAWRPHLTTVFDPPARTAPRLPVGLDPWRDDPTSRFAQGILLLAYAVVAGALDRVLRGGGARLAAVAAAALVVSVGIVASSPEDPGRRVHGIVMDLGGGGARRVEAVAVAAGPAGWEGEVAWPEGGIVATLGGERSGASRWRVRPGRTAWFVRDTVGRGGHPAPSPSPHAPDLALLLRGNVEPARLTTGRGAAPAARLDGAPLARGWWIRWR